MIPKLASLCLAALFASMVIGESRSTAHEPLTAEQIARWKTDHSYQERIARMRRNDPEKISPGLAPVVAFKMQIEALRAQGISPAQISAQLFTPPRLNFPYAAHPDLPAKDTPKMLTILVDFEWMRCSGAKQ